MTFPVKLYIYDLSQGMARSLGPALGLHDLEGVWHTAIIVHNTEIFFGGSGIEHCLPGSTMLGQPLEIKNLGNTSIDMGTLTSYLRNIGSNEYHGSRYDLFQHNCNNFSDTLAKFLGLPGIPQYILDLPSKVMNSPIAAMLRPIMEQATPGGQGTPFGDSSSPSMAMPSNTPKTEEFFPPKEYCVIKPSFDIDKVINKLIEFNQCNQTSFAISDDDMTKLRLLDENGVKVDDGILVLISNVLTHWPKENTFPLLNIVCCNVAREGMDKEISLKTYKLLKKHKMFSTDSPHARMCLRILVNNFAKDGSRQIMLEQREEIVADLNALIEGIEGEVSPQVENATASLVLNFAKAINEKGGDSEAAIQIVSSLLTVFIVKFKGPEALFKVVSALGTLIKQDSDVKSLAEALDAITELKKIPKNRMSRLDSCVSACIGLLN